MKRREREACFRQWLERHRGILVSISAGFAAPDDRDDLLQEMMLALWHAIPAFRGDSSPATFIYRVAQNTALVWRRSRVRVPQGTELDPELADPAGASPPVVLDRAIRDESLHGAIRKLAPADRNLVLMHLDGLSYREMSAVTGLSESNVGARLSRARQRLNRLLTGGGS